jgi:indole-3-glycerol phosphate synthase
VTAGLPHILEATRRQVRALRGRAAELESEASAAPVPPAWREVLVGADVALIAEIKRRSPSAGTIASDLEPATRASAYVAGGARAISVLTEGTHFGGSLADLEEVCGAVQVPLLRKDFIIDPVQLYEARAAGASAVLLIARALEGVLLADLAHAAQELGLARLFEVHDPAELDRVLALEPESVGVNSRDLETFAVDLSAIEPVLRRVPAGVIAVAESGLATRDDVQRVAEWGADAVLVGTALARAQDPAWAAGELCGVPRRPGGRPDAGGASVPRAGDRR